MLILKDVDDDGWHFATSRVSRKGRHIRHCYGQEPLS